MHANCPLDIAKLNAQFGVKNVATIVYYNRKAHLLFYFLRRKSSLGPHALSPNIFKTLIYCQFDMPFAISIKFNT